MDARGRSAAVQALLDDFAHSRRFQEVVLADEVVGVPEVGRTKSVNDLPGRLQKGGNAQ